MGVRLQCGDQVDFANSRLGDQIEVETFVNWNVNSIDSLTTSDRTWFMKIGYAGTP